MNKIQNVLNDEESMKQIKELADMLTADNGGQGEQGGGGRAGGGVGGHLGTGVQYLIFYSDGFHSIPLFDF